MGIDLMLRVTGVPLLCPQCRQSQPTAESLCSAWQREQDHPQLWVLLWVWHAITLRQRLAETGVQEGSCRKSSTWE